MQGCFDWILFFIPRMSRQAGVEFPRMGECFLDWACDGVNTGSMPNHQVKKES